MTTLKQTTNRRLNPGTPVVSEADGNAIDAWSYLVETAYGRETWDAGDLFVPEKD